MTDVLEFSDISAEIKGAMCPGRLKLTDQHIIFKNNKTGKVEQIPSGDLDLCNWQRLVGTCCLRIFLKNGSIHRFCGFKEAEQEKVAKYFKKTYSSDLLEKELCLKGWNWGTAKFNGSVLSFDINNQAAFEVPLTYVSQCTTGKNEVAIEFHQNDETPVSLMEMRFHIPTSELAGDDPVEAFKAQVMTKASVISIFGDAIAIFREIHCVTPRGRYDIKLFQSFFQLHGKTFDYKIPMETVIRLFVLPHKDGRQNFFVVSLDPPIKQGQTRYHYLVFLFNQDEETSIELPFTEEELKEKYEGKLTKELSGPTYDVVSRVMKALVNRKITVPGNFKGHSGTAAIGCSYKAAAGCMYPLERGFIFIHKPPIHIRFEEISTVNFARSGGSTRSFDFEIELKSGVVHTFSSIEKEEYGKLFDFISSKKLRVKNKKSDKPDYSGMDDFGDSDVEDEPDAYLARVKREGKEREEEDGDSEDESEDEDFKPGQEESDVAEEYESNPDTTSESDEEGSGNESGGSVKEKKEKKKKEKKEKKEKKAKTVSEKPRKKRRTKKEKDANAPKRAPSAYMLWFNESREQIKKDFPGLSVTETAKKAGELWKALTDRVPWEKKAAKLKEEYIEAMKEYKASGGGIKKGGDDSDGGDQKKKKKERKKKESASPVKAGSGTNFISKEFIESDSSSEDSEGKKGDSKKSKGKSKPKAEKEASASDTKPSDSESKESEGEKAKAKPKSKPEKKDSDSDEKASDSDAKAKPKSKPEKKDSDSDAKASESDASDSDKGSEKASKKPSKEKASKKGKDSGDESEEEEEEEEILSTPTASSDSD